MRQPAPSLPISVLEQDLLALCLQAKARQPQRHLEPRDPGQAAQVRAAVRGLQTRAQCVCERELQQLFNRHENWTAAEREAVSHCLEEVITRMLLPAMDALHDPRRDTPEVLHEFADIFDLHDFTDSINEVAS